MPDPRDISVNELLSRVVSAIVDHPNEVKVGATWGDVSATLTVRVHPDDTGKLIGKQGRHIKSLRTIIGCVGMKQRRRIVLAVGDRDGHS
jgi:uncharacterized protein